YAIPGISASSVWPGDAVKSPSLFAGFGVEADDVATAFDPTSDALHDFAFRDEWAACQLPSLGRIGDRLIPYNRASLHVERNDMNIGGADKEFVAVERHVLFHSRTHVFGEFPRVMPEFVACGGIERLDVVTETVDKDHTIVNERCRFVGSGRQGQRPCDS